MQEDDDKASVSSEDLEDFCNQLDEEELDDIYRRALDEPVPFAFLLRYWAAGNATYEHSLIAEDWTVDTTGEDDLEAYLMRGVLDSPDEETQMLYWKCLQHRLQTVRYWKLI